MEKIIISPLFGITLAVLSFETGLYIKEKLKSPLANPLLIASAICMMFLTAFKIPVENFMTGGNFISMFLFPSTAVLAVSVYKSFETLKKNLLPVISGCFAGALTSILSVKFLCRLFNFTDQLTFSLVPKSVTTPIAMEIAKSKGGIPSITVAAVIVTGIMGAVLSPLLIRFLKIKNPVEAGIAIGASSHALGTSKAIEIGETEGAMSGIAIGVTGIITVLLAMLF